EPGQSSAVGLAGDNSKEDELNALEGKGKETYVEKLLKDSCQSSFAILAEVNPEEDEVNARVQETADEPVKPSDQEDLQCVIPADKDNHSWEPQDPVPKSLVHNIASEEEFPAVVASPLIHSGRSGSPSFKIIAICMLIALGGDAPSACYFVFAAPELYRLATSGFDLAYVASISSNLILWSFGSSSFAR
ncbi:hypothetical protein U1Q18_014154, partial [Sarracenia purpurea var. burkii]